MCGEAPAVPVALGTFSPFAVTLGDAAFRQSSGDTVTLALPVLMPTGGIAAGVGGAAGEGDMGSGGASVDGDVAGVANTAVASFSFLFLFFFGVCGVMALVEDGSVTRDILFAETESPATAAGALVLATVGPVVATLGARITPAEAGASQGMI